MKKASLYFLVPLLILVINIAGCGRTTINSNIETNNINREKTLKKSMTTLKILTYNTGLLRIKLPLYTYEFTPHLEERLENLSVALLSLNPDIITLQEIYLNKHKEKLISNLKIAYPYHYSTTHKKLIGLTDGLLLLSKFPIKESNYYNFKRAPFLEKILVQKGYTKSILVLSNNMQIELINTHTTAGGLFHKPESYKAEEYRLAEQQELVNTVKLNNRHNIPTIIAGDFNCSPTVSRKNFQHLLRNNWTSSYDAFYRDNASYLNENKHPTWAVSNPLNTLSPHSDSPNQRIDHIFLSPKAHIIFSITDSRIVLQKPIVYLSSPHKNLNGTSKVSLSDHYGLLTTLTIKQAF